MEVLKQIGEAIGRVLRIDSHIAMEARGRYARLCILLDVTKLLINIVLIGRFEQSVVYEGLHKLCFSCGRIGHRKESCPFTIKKLKSLVEGDRKGLRTKECCCVDCMTCPALTQVVERRRTGVIAWRIGTTLGCL